VRYLSRMDTLLLSKYEAARLLGVSIRSLEHLISRQEIPTRRIGRRVLIARSAIQAFARGQISNESVSQVESPRDCQQEEDPATPKPVEGARERCAIRQTRQTSGLGQRS
jgi:excisionase family DNA binding protein